MSVLSAANRLRDRADFAAVRQHGRRWRGALLIINVVRQAAQGPSRFGFVVSRRIGKAVARNRVKRRLRAIIRRHVAGLVRGYDVVIIARPEVSGASFAELNDAALDLLRLARLMPGLPEVS
jgi:ribonuclease P protein component